MREQSRVEYRRENCPVLDNRSIAPGFNRITLRAPGIAGSVKAGQFVQLFIPPYHGYMLPRPFSVYKADPVTGEITLLIEIKGRGSGLLAGACPGTALELLGPLGKGFPVPPPGSLLVAGGVGIAPLALLAASTSGSQTMLYCARTVDMLFCPRSDLERPGLNIIEATDDGSRGIKGSAADILPRWVKEAKAVFACGPRPMLAAVKTICLEAGVGAWLSLEERMACGIGACLGCVTLTTRGYRRVCRDGPVFAAEEVIFDE